MSSRIIYVRNIHRQHEQDDQTYYYDYTVECDQASGMLSVSFISYVELTDDQIKEKIIEAVNERTGSNYTQVEIF